MLLLALNALRMSGRNYSTNFRAFKDVFDKCKNIVVITGAGISAESKIPVFRGPSSIGGVYKTFDMSELATPEGFKRNPSLVWEFYHYRREVVFKAEPNKAHVTLAKCEMQCKEQKRHFTIITQNIDGLHQRAGSMNVLELHGSIEQVQCTKCGSVELNRDSPICPALAGKGNPESLRENMGKTQVADLPKCKKCNALLRPNVVWFGEQLDPTVIETASNLVANCDICLVVGTSSKVYPAAAYAPSVAIRGKPVAEFNVEIKPTQKTSTLYFRGLCTETLPKALGIEV